MAKKSIGESLALQLELKEQMKFDVKTGTVKVPKTYYEKSLEAQGLDLETQKKYQRHEMDMLAATYVAGGQVVAEELKENPELGEVQLQYNSGYNEHHLFFRPNAEENEESVRDVTTYHEPNKGTVKEAQDLVQSLFDAMDK